MSRVASSNTSRGGVNAIRNTLQSSISFPIKRSCGAFCDTEEIISALVSHSVAPTLWFMAVGANSTSSRVSSHFGFRRHWTDTSFLAFLVNSYSDTSFQHYTSKYFADSPGTVYTAFERLYWFCRTGSSKFVLQRLFHPLFRIYCCAAFNYCICFEQGRCTCLCPLGQAARNPWWPEIQ